MVFCMISFVAHVYSTTLISRCSAPCLNIRQIPVNMIGALHFYFKNYPDTKLQDTANL